jgi:hypothetical protein
MGRFILGFIIGYIASFVILTILRASSESDREEEDHSQRGK